MVHADPWASFEDGLMAEPDFIGPFPHQGFLAAAEQAIDPTGELVTFSDASGSVALVIENGTVRFAGHESITDYHSPLGADATQVLVSAFGELGGLEVRLDSLPQVALETVTTALDRVGAPHTVSQHAATGVLMLPADIEDWLMSIGKKERHEVRRKRRRFESEYGEIVVERSGIEALDAFCDLHRTSPGDKGSFMTDRMQTFFGALITDAGAIIHDLRCADGTLASAFGFETDDAYYYYNSAFDGSAASSSPGIVLLSMLVSAQIDRGARVFDFLKGAEVYKYRHGAEARDLFTVEGSLP